ncbi:MAG: YggT family protein [Bifidobacteriaceae bacterium]|jgi:YggT family protein|nr:YggT family protein [Bifidobacteriaceae bacterium]MCI1979044.1 YggT family protein [Bifidobacteriaceae bacterium]
MLGIIASIVRWLIGVYITVLFARMIVDWVLVLARGWRPRGVISDIIRIIYDLTEPPLRWLRRYVPSIPLGPVRLDVSFIVLYFILVVAQVII